MNQNVSWLLQTVINNGDIFFSIIYPSVAMVQKKSRFAKHKYSVQQLNCNRLTY